MSLAGDAGNARRVFDGKSVGNVTICVGVERSELRQRLALYVVESLVEGGVRDGVAVRRPHGRRVVWVKRQKCWGFRGFCYRL